MGKKKSTRIRKRLRKGRATLIRALDNPIVADVVSKVASAAVLTVSATIGARLFGSKDEEREGRAGGEAGPNGQPMAPMPVVLIDETEERTSSMAGQDDYPTRRGPDPSQPQDGPIGGKGSDRQRQDGDEIETGGVGQGELGQGAQRHPGGSSRDSEKDEKHG